MQDAQGRKVFHSLLWYLAAAVISIAVVVGVLRLWRADLWVPFCYGGDGLYTGLWIKGIIDNGWYLDNDRVGAPGGVNLADFPLADNLHFLVLKLIGLAVRDWALTLNLYYLLTFPLVAVTSLGVLRHFGISYPPALLASLLYALLPYHFLRGELHLFLSAYYLVPPLVMVILWVYLGEPILCRRDSDGWRWKLRDGKTWTSIAICLLVSSGGVYYAFFGCYFLLVAALGASLQRRSRRPLLVGLVLIGVTVLGGLANLSPSLVHKLRHGHNEEAVRRHFVEADIYGLKVAHLVLPVTNHRIAALRQLKQTYMAAPYSSEDSAALGFIGTAGFVGLAGWLLCRLRAGDSSVPLDGLALISAAGVLLATIGGLGALVSLLVTDWIRAYNRVTVFIAFVCFFAVAWALDGLASRLAVLRRRPRLFAAGLAGLFLLGTFDQTTQKFIPHYKDLQNTYYGDAEFVQAMEAALPDGASVFQLPYVPFPENPPVHRMGDYEHFRGYLHARTLRWSYGTVKGREGDRWQREMAGKPAGDLVKGLALAGFRGLYINGHGYSDGAEALAARLTEVLGAEPHVHRDGRLLFFNLSEWAEQLRAALSPSEWEAARHAALHPLQVFWEGGFDLLEGLPDRNWRWCSQAGELRLYNPSQRDKEVTVDFRCRTAAEVEADLWISGPGFSDRLRIDTSGTPYERSIRVPAGASLRVTFTCNTPPLGVSAHETRVICFGVDDFAAREFDSLPSPRALPQPAARAEHHQPAPK
jgi:phosphoglycerol transferase